MAALQTVDVRALARFSWLGQPVAPGQRVAMPPHVARAQAAAGRVEYVNATDRGQVTRAVTPPMTGIRLL